MNAPLLDRSNIRDELVQIGAHWGLVITGILPSGYVSHPSNDDPIAFLAEKAREDVSALDVASAEVELNDRIRFASRIVLRSELMRDARGRDLIAKVREV